MKGRNMQRVTVRLGDTEAHNAMRHLCEKTWAHYYLNLVAESVAQSVGAQYDGYEMEADPATGQAINRLDLLFEADPMQLRQIEGIFAGNGLEVVPDAPPWGAV